MVCYDFLAPRGGGALKGGATAMTRKIRAYHADSPFGAILARKPQPSVKEAPLHGMSSFGATSKSESEWYATTFWLPGGAVI